MSFSFSVQAADKEALIEAVSEEMDKVVTQQPVHSVDAAAVKGTAALYINLLHDEADKDVRISVSGSVSYRYGEDGTSYEIQGSNISVGALFVQRVETATEEPGQTKAD